MAPQDSFIDEDDDTCPLCVEEFDLSDKNFRPCPCGYQVCQFCFNNIKNNMNGLCPACRRPYDEKTIEWKVVTPEEIAQFKANIQKNAKKKAEQRQKEAQKREVESQNRKHLSGLRVVQKNLVYVVGLSPGIREDEILQTLRGEKYFGQYGKIIKIVVSKAKQNDGSQNGSLGVYVTFARKEDAARCIAAVNGSQNGERVLRAQLGTTKYCSAYLRNETCTNKQCMFLHEPGDNDDSYSRQDLSSMNSVNTQRPLPPAASASAARQAAISQAPLQQSQPIAAATQPMARDTSKDGSDSGDGSALPSSASWANRPTQQRSRRGSHATSRATASPAVSSALPVPAESVEEVMDEVEEADEPEDSESSSETQATTSAITSSPLPEYNPALVDLLKAINSPLILLPIIDVEESSANLIFPPLFDDCGGQKRRAFREQEEARLHLEHDSQPDPVEQVIAEPIEEDEPESGSFQLGGEPEHIEGREGNQSAGFNNQRQANIQLPIQRGGNNGSFGPLLGQNINQSNTSNLGSINGRSLTPLQQQQLLLFKSGQPQAGFVDQFPPGIGSSTGQNSTLFQQQGHNRQSSRYSFANDGASTSGIKPSANSKLMAQQSSMMPPTSHAQQSNQYYPSSMPGPPPGLKSSGTPPISGTMFGQGHTFGGSMNSNAAFANAQKENSGDMIRDMLRSRGATAGNQSDTGKREYMFPSFLQQYPSASSTPAPVSGLLASLYGPQTGAFHDFGQKQKKKGKKHRHANTSSSGGGGLVDLVDPSILQARMHHQQQSNAGVGQVFGGQAQDDQTLIALDEASLSVDALVADSVADYTAPVGFDALNHGSRSSTPSVPPGFSLPYGHLAAQEDLGLDTSSRIASSGAIPRASTPLSLTSVLSTPIKSSSTPTKPASPAPRSKSTLKAQTANSDATKSLAFVPPAALRPSDFPALGSTKVKHSTAQDLAKITITNSTTSPRKSAPSNTSASSAQSNMKVVEKRTVPGILNISVPAKQAPKNAGLSESVKPGPVTPSFPPLPPSTPSAASQPVSSRAGPKTLRVVPNSKPDLTAGSGATPSSATATNAPAFPSRQASIASNSRLDRPLTPSSDFVSDNASVTSTSMSRANSPPPSKIGSAPLRATTKSMAKKQRREAQKEREKSQFEIEALKATPEVEIAPILGRKKKQKKERVATNAPRNSTPTTSQPASPGVTMPHSAEPSDTISVESTKLIENNKISAKVTESKGKGKAKAQQFTLAETFSPVEQLTEEPTTRIPTATEVFQDLRLSGCWDDPENLSIFKAPIPIDRNLPVDAALSLNQKLTITAEDRATLMAGNSVHKVEESYRIMLTPNGDCIRNLTEGEEERYLELQSSIAQQAGPTSFVHPMYQASSNGFRFVEGRAVPNGPPSFFPPSTINNVALDPVSKIQRDEALGYINQYVLPSLSTSSQKDKALNVNALDAEMLRSNELSGWASWNGDAATIRASTEVSQTRDGPLTSGLETITAQYSGRETERGPPLGSVTLLSLSEAEAAMQLARKETDALEKKLNGLIKKNRRLFLGAGH